MSEIKSSEFLGKEKIAKLMAKFCIPCVLSLLVSALYNIVDQIFIGNSELSTLGNAATGVVFPLFIIAQAFAWWFGDGCAAYLNIHQGRSDTGENHKCIGTGIVFTLLSSIVLIAVFYPLKLSVLKLFGASDNTVGMASEYFNIILGFFPIYMLSNMINGVIRADGSPSWSMFSMLTGAVINIILDPIFIFVCHMRMSGAAWATVIGQTASFAVSVAYLFRTKTFKLKLKSFIPDLKSFYGAVKLGLSSFFTQMTIVVIAVLSNVMLAKYGALSHYGADIPIAVIGIESKVFTVVISLVVGIALGAQPIIGYNIGANNIGRVKKLYLFILACTLAIGAIATLIFELAPEAVAGIFGTPQNIPNPNDYWDFSRKTFRIFLSLISFTCVIKMTSIFFQAAGKPMSAVIMSLIRDILCFVPLIVILPIYMGIDGILIAAPISDAVAMAVTLALSIAFFGRLNKKSKLTAEGTEYIREWETPLAQENTEI